MAKLTIDKNACKGCGLCIEACPKKILVLSQSNLNTSGYSPIELTDKSACIACGFCAQICPDFVFTIEK